MAIPSETKWRAFWMFAACLSFVGLILTSYGFFNAYTLFYKREYIVLSQYNDCGTVPTTTEGQAAREMIACSDYDSSVNMPEDAVFVDKEPYETHKAADFSVNSADLQENCKTVNHEDAPATLYNPCPRDPEYTKESVTSDYCTYQLALSQATAIKACVIVSALIYCCIELFFIVDTVAALKVVDQAKEENPEAGLGPVHVLDVIKYIFKWFLITPIMVVLTISPTVCMEATGIAPKTLVMLMYIWYGCLFCICIAPCVAYTQKEKDDTVQKIAMAAACMLCVMVTISVGLNIYLQFKSISVPSVDHLNMGFTLGGQVFNVGGLVMLDHCIPSD